MATTVRTVRIYIRESDTSDHSNLMQEIVRRLHEEHQVRGVTVYRGIAGFGTDGEVHSADLLRLHADLPLVLEFFDEPETVAQALEWLTEMVSPGHILAWNAELL